MKIALIGYGKMGHEIEKVALERGHQIVCIVDIDENDKFNSPEFKSADIAIEFTTPKSALNNYRKAFESNIPVVSGTTGWLEYIDEIKNECNNNGKTFFYASNFSLGVNLFFAVNRYLSKLMNKFPAYDVTMEETHHIHKLDAPSGTAITIAEDILSNIERKNSWALHNESADNNINNKSDIIKIKDFREGEVPGIHTVIYESEIDSIKITHEAKSRKGFAIGAVLAAEFTKDKKGFLGMQDLLGNL
jgi:4-hydroxy-tetrahydrodipicolinate reductase